MVMQRGCPVLTGESAAGLIIPRPHRDHELAAGA